MRHISARTVVTIVLVGALVLTAGCTGVLDDGEPNQTESEESTATNATAMSEERSETEGGDGHGHSHGEGEHAHSHGTDDGSDANAQANETDQSATDGSEPASGRVTVAINGSELDLAARQRPNGTFGVSDSDEHAWTASETGATLSEALEDFDVEATASQLRADGEQYSDEESGTTVVYRVNGDPVDPEEYVVQDGDWVWITVTTEQTNLSDPGEYIRAADQHAHGEMDFVVDGEPVDFSREKFQSNHRHFHYEHGDGEIWHAHSVSLSLEYALSSLTDIEVDGDVVTYNGTTYDPETEGTSVEITVNDEPVDPGEYVLQDGDYVTVDIESES